MNSIFPILCLIGAAYALPKAKELQLGNPNEWGDYYQGDIRLPLPMMGKNGMIDTRYRWPNAQVPFTYASTFQASKIPTVQVAMQSISDITGGCVTFIPRTTEINYVEFVGDDLDGCWSYVGRIGGKQNINYPQWCIDSLGSVQHELLHALGFQHEQCTYNRDDYVTIQYQNVEPGYEYAFDKFDSTVVTDFGTAYDYMSIMHYSQFAFTVNGLRTILTTDPAYQNLIGQSFYSSTDIFKLNTMYGCP